MEAKDAITEAAVRDIVTLLALAYQRYAAKQRQLNSTTADSETAALDKAGTPSGHVQ
jgi:hypothetical protein